MQFLLSHGHFLSISYQNVYQHQKMLYFVESRKFFYLIHAVNIIFKRYTLNCKDIREFSSHLGAQKVPG